jgi:hypothetical protein
LQLGYFGNKPTEVRLQASAAVAEILVPRERAGVGKLASDAAQVGIEILRADTAAPGAAALHPCRESDLECAQRPDILLKRRVGMGTQSTGGKPRDLPAALGAAREYRAAPVSFRFRCRREGSRLQHGVAQLPQSHHFWVDHG